MKITKAEKAAHAEFVREFNQLMENRTEIETIAGRYTFEVDPVADGFCTVFGRFDKPSRAKTYVDCNQFSGKWNFHFGKLTGKGEAKSAAGIAAGKITAIAAP